jgi:hypothetical protein
MQNKGQGLLKHHRDEAPGAFYSVFKFRPAGAKSPPV